MKCLYDDTKCLEVESSEEFYKAICGKCRRKDINWIVAQIFVDAIEWFGQIIFATISSIALVYVIIHKQEIIFYLAKQLSELLFI